MISKNIRLLVTGATGYIGGRLVTRLLDEGYSVRVLVRDAARLRGRSWSDRVEIVQGDVFDSGSLTPGMAGVDIAYYLVHSMAGSDNFEQRDIVASQNFGKASHEANVQRIIYLGGLGSCGAAGSSSPCLRLASLRSACLIFTSRPSPLAQRPCAKIRFNSQPVNSRICAPTVSPPFLCRRAHGFDGALYAGLCHAGGADLLAQSH